MYNRDFLIKVFKDVELEIFCSKKKSYQQNRKAI